MPTSSKKGEITIITACYNKLLAPCPSVTSRNTFRDEVGISTYSLQELSSRKILVHLRKIPATNGPYSFCSMNYWMVRVVADQSKKKKRGEGDFGMVKPLKAHCILKEGTRVRGCVLLCVPFPITLIPSPSCQFRMLYQLSIWKLKWVLV